MVVISAFVAAMMNSQNATAATGDRTIAGCGTLDGQSWGKFCVVYTPHEGTFADGSRYYRHTDMTVVFADTKTNGHYVILQRNLSWVDDNWQWVDSTGSYKSINLLYAFDCWSTVKFRLLESGTGELSSVVTVHQGKAPYCKYVLPSNFIPKA